MFTTTFNYNFHTKINVIISDSTLSTMPHINPGLFSGVLTPVPGILGMKLLLGSQFFLKQLYSLRVLFVACLSGFRFSIYCFA